MKKISVFDVLFLIAFTCWVYYLDFSSLGRAEIASLAVFGLWTGFIAYRLFNKR